MNTTTSRRITVRDRGLQAERTTLAWSRTALALAVASLLAGRTLAVHFSAWVAVLPAAGGLTAAAAIHIAHRRYRHWTYAGRQTYRPGVGNLALATVVTALGVAALAATVTALIL